jgi:putative endonuclease
MPLHSDPRTWSDPRHRRGLRGEEIAKDYLRRLGWCILAHRFRVGRWEVDLIARLGDVVAFIEVKTRAGDGFGKPIEAITWGKRREMTRVARAWVDRHGLESDTYRFDAIGVSLRGRPRVDHVPNAFWVDWR